MFRSRKRKTLLRTAASLLPCIIVVLMLVCVFAPLDSQASTYSPKDGNYDMVDDYWPMDKTGPGTIAYLSGSQVWYGHAPVAGEQADFMRDDGTTYTGTASDGQVGWRIDSNGGMSWGNEVDRKWVMLHDLYGVWDLGAEFSSVVVFPSIDDWPVPGEALGFIVWGSNDFNAGNPSLATWVPAYLTTVYRKGWSSVGDDKFAVCNDDYVSVWDWDTGTSGGGGYRFIKLEALAADPNWDPDADPEIDAVKGVAGSSSIAACGWQAGVVEQGRTFNYTSLKIGADGRAHIAYGGEELYYAVYDDATWHVQQVDRHGVGAYSSLALDSLGKAAISYYESANGDLKYAHQDGTLHDVWGSAANSVFAVGDNGTILHWDGNAWSPMASGTTNTLNSVWGTSPTNVFAAGASGTILHWDGSAWSPMVSGTTNTLSSVWGSDASHVFAVGASGTVRYYNGSSWGNAPGTTGSGTTNDLRGVWGSDASHVFAVGVSGTVRYYNGSSWDNAPGTTGSGTTHSLADVWGSSSSNVFAVGESGTILRYNGSAWAAVSVGVADCLNSVWGTSSSDVFAVGCRGIILHWNGTSWSSMNSGTTNALQGVWGNSAANVFAVGYEGTIVGYDGVIWTTAASGNGWVIETVDSSGDVGSHTSLAFDTMGRPCISYSDATNGNLKYASWDGARWTVTTVDSTGWVGTYTSLAFNSLGRPAISYYDATNGDLRLAQWDGTCWVIATIDSSVDVGSYSSLAFDASDKPAISYHDATEGKLKYAHWSGTAWNIEAVDSKGWVGEYSSLAFDTSNRPGVSYYAAGEHDLKYAHWNGTKWDITTVDKNGDVGSYTSLDFDTSGKPAVSYYDATNDALKYAAWNGTTWKVETVNGVWWVGRFSSLAFDGSNNRAISYYDPEEGDLKYGHWLSDNWTMETVDSYGDVGRYTSLAFDGSGYPAISYYDASRGDLKYAHWNGASWDIYTPDSVGDVGSHSSLAFDGSGNPAIAYYDATNGNLKYAHWNGTNWEALTVDSTGDVGSYASLAFDPSGNPAISYYDATSGDLKYAHWNGTSWDMEIVDSTSDVGSYTSLALDCVGNPAISYHDATNGDLKYARWNGANWGIEVVDSKGWTGLYTSLAFDGSDTSANPAISYHEASEGDLKYAHWNGKSWDIETVDSADWAGRYTSLAFDGCGAPAISYDAATNGDLKYAHPLNPAPNQPSNKGPSDNATYVSLTPVLECSAFADPCTDSHAASQWQITTTAGDYCKPVFDSGADSTDLAQITVPAGVLSVYTTYYWQVRHQDCHGAWSDYSAETSFTTLSPPKQPTNITPSNKTLHVSLAPMLIASAFSDPQAGDNHAASQWQITTKPGVYSSPIFDRSGTNLTQISVPAGVLTYSTTYYWQVRYQDNHDAWSKYSTETVFITQNAPVPPVQPVNMAPESGATGISVTPTLQSSPFSDSDTGDSHTASQWQVTTIAGDYSTTVFDSGQDAANLTMITIPNGVLEHNTTYYWQVRHLDSQGVWSNWSTETGFTTEPAPGMPPALLIAGAVIAVVILVGAGAPMMLPL